MKVLSKKAIHLPLTMFNYDILNRLRIYQLFGGKTVDLSLKLSLVSSIAMWSAVIIKVSCPFKSGLSIDAYVQRE